MRTMRSILRTIIRIAGGGCDCREQLLCCDPRCRIVAEQMLTYYVKVGDSVSG